MYTFFFLENLKGRDHLKDVGIDGKNIRMDVTEDIKWMHLAQDRDQGRAAVNTELNLRVLKRRGISLLN
jgi:hypothetical protein